MARKTRSCDGDRMDLCFTLIIVITFAIEIGQKVTNTGNMEFADIVFGVVGFIVMFLFCGHPGDL